MASVAGFDIGDQASCVAVARKRGIDVLMNKESKRETPSVVSFGNKNRLLGTDAVGTMSIAPRQAITEMKRLLGKKFNNPDVQRDIQKLPYAVVEGPDGGCLIKVQYLGKEEAFAPEQVVAAMMVDLKEIAEADNSAVTDVVIAVPAYFTVPERLAMLKAAQIADVKCLRLFHDTTAIALAYGIVKTDLPEKDPVYVAFVDVGHTAFQVSIVAFTKGRLEVKSHAWNRNLGGRDFDEVLFNHFAKEFGDKHKIDIPSNPRASFRLRMACEKLKKILSANPEAPINVECLMNDIDVRSTMTRDMFEEMATKVLQRARPSLEQALADAGISTDQVSSVEVTGGSSRVPALIKILKEFFNKEPSRTLNAKEVISRGCALQCAMLSPIFRVREFEVKDVNPYPVDMMWDRNGEVSRNHIFESYSAIPTTKQITTAYRETALDITAEYAETAPLPEGFDRFIGKFTVGPPKPPAPTASSTKLKIKVQLNLHDVVDVVGAQQIDEEEYEEVVKKPAAAASAAKDVSMEGADEPSKPPPDATDDVTMADTPAEPSPPDQAEASDAQPMETDKEAAAAAGTDGNASAETEEVVKKRRQKKTDLPIQVQLPGWDQAQVKKMRGREEEMAWQDKKQRLTNEAKNALEAYIYDFRNKLSDQLADFVTDDHKGNLTVKLEQTEDWLYDEGEDQEREVYENKLEELRSQGIPIERRAIEHQTRPSAAQSLLGTARRLEQAAQSTDAKYSHISPEDKRKVVDECQKAVAWLQEKHKLQEGAKKSDDPMLLTADIRKKEDTLVRFAEPILNKPAPPPPKPEAKKDEKAQGDAMETDAAGADTAAAGPTAAEAAQAAANNASKDDATMEA